MEKSHWLDIKFILKIGVLMKNFLLLTLLLTSSFSLASKELDLEKFAQTYFKLMTDTQKKC